MRRRSLADDLRTHREASGHAPDAYEFTCRVFNRAVRDLVGRVGAEIDWRSCMNFANPDEYPIPGDAALEKTRRADQQDLRTLAGPSRGLHSALVAGWTGRA